jgi:hypothetical protein
MIVSTVKEEKKKVYIIKNFPHHKKTHTRPKERGKRKKGKRVKLPFFAFRPIPPSAMYADI